MRYLPILFLALACSPKHEEMPDYSLPPELKDCKVFMISDGGPNRKELYVVKCPNAVTTTSWTAECGDSCTTTEHLTLVQE
jgi:hypothetical protein